MVDHMYALKGHCAKFSSSTSNCFYVEEMLQKFGSGWVPVIKWAAGPVPGWAPDYRWGQREETCKL